MKPIIKKHKEVILEIINKSGGKILRADLKDMVIRKMDLEEYAKQTFSEHIKQLEAEGKIIREQVDSKTEYISIPRRHHPVAGGLFLEDLKGRIFVPDLLMDAGISIVEGVPQDLKKDHLSFIFEFNSRTITLIIPKERIPFKLHVSRKKYEDQIHPLINKEFGGKTITLELPIPQISSYPINSPNDEKRGQILLNFEFDQFTIEDLGASNPSKLTFIKNLNLETFRNELSLFSDDTVDQKFERRSSQIKGKDELMRKTELQFKCPILILLSDDSQLGIF